MIKTTAGFFLLAILLAVIFLNTHITLLGSGFLIGDGTHVLTYHGLVKKAESLKIKFPNEDDIEAKKVFLDPKSNLAVLKLQEMPKVKRQPLQMSHHGLNPKDEPVFTLGYPWANTLADKHVLIDGFAKNGPILIDLNMALDPVHSGSPLFNARQEVVGMVLLSTHAKNVFPVKGSNHFALPVRFLKKSLQAVKISATLSPQKNLTKEAFISISKNNIVLVEAR